MKKKYRIAQRLKHSTSQNESKKKIQREKIIKVHKDYIELAQNYLNRINLSIKELENDNSIISNNLEKLNIFISHAKRQINQIILRVFNGEKIPHSDKIFSVFEDYTEWISKGKSGVTQELGLKVCIIADQFGFLLHHHIMQKELDQDIAVSMVKEVKNKYPELNSCSFDKGFSTPENRKRLSKMLETCILPKRGKLSKLDWELENCEDFIKGRRKHSGIESCINALENHGLDRCPDKGLHGFKRYIGLAVLALNIQKLGHIIQSKKIKKLKRNRA